jgi:precorrin-3B synthase
VHQAADGGVARIRVPGGQLTARQFGTVAGAAAELGDGTVELTSRANLQLRGLADGAEVALGERLGAVGLLPSVTHERVRNIIASPLSGRDGNGCTDVRSLVRELDSALYAELRFAGLPGRFLFTVDDGRGDVAWLDADVAALFVAPGTAAILLAGQDVGLRAVGWRVLPMLLAAAGAFLELRGEEWRIAELADGPRRIAELVRTVNAPESPGLHGVPATRGPVGRIAQADGLVSVAVVAPLGRLTGAQAVALGAASDALVITPWRGVVVADLTPGDADGVAESLRSKGLLVDPEAPGIGVSACTGRPGCARALADVRADAALMLGMPRDSLVPGNGLLAPRGANKPLPAVHWSGCERRCGRPRGEVLDVVATEDGYTMRRGLL